MIRRLRIKFVCINMTIVTVMLLVIFGMLLHFTRQELEQQSFKTLQDAARDREVPGRPGDPGPIKQPWFRVTINDAGQRTVISNGFYDLSDEQLLDEILRQVQESPEQTGVLRQYGFRFRKSTGPYGKRIAFVDISAESATMKGLYRNCLMVGILSIGAFFLVSILLARWAVRPVEKAWNQQRQFVADASHELKTPLTVIMTNAQLLQDPQYGEGERQGFADSILTMSRQMRQLVERMLELARVDNGTAKMEHSRLDLSTLMAECLLPFEPVYFERQLQLESVVEEGIFLSGSDSHLRQVLDILLDNGAKYTSPGGTVQVRLVRSGSGCLLSVAGPGETISREDLKNIFKRFYRIDKARHRDGSYGLGLSIAENIVREHRGKIWAESKEGINTFFVHLPCCGQS